MSYIAHTPPKDFPERQPHRYVDHIGEVSIYGLALFDYLLLFCSFEANEKRQLRQSLQSALMLHDIGKLDEDNQLVLRSDHSGCLKVDHLEAGVAIADEMGNELLGWLIRGHHAPGLPSKKTEKYFIKQLRNKFKLPLSSYCLRGGRYARDKNSADWEKHKDAILLTNNRLQDYKKRQVETCGEWPKLDVKLPAANLTIRKMLSCLVDADHTSAACYSQSIPMPTFGPADTRWKKRLDALDAYMSKIVSESKDPDSERNKMRGEFYQHSLGVDIFEARCGLCSAPVGMGKTTSILAYLLRCAIRDNLSRIFIIAPFSNIIDQTVKVLREAVVLNGEDAQAVVVAHHHKADFSSKEMRQYTASWQAPVVVTTAVQFFETLAACQPSKLRKLHNVVGSAIFIDESHACVPVELLAVSWSWLKQLVENWGCHIIFSSGSMTKFWEDRELINQEPQYLSDLFPKGLSIQVKKTEKRRVVFERIEEPLGCEELLEIIQSQDAWEGIIKQNKPSCLIILNTVQSAAVIAYRLARQLGDVGRELKDKKVLHLSTALAPKDRDKMLGEVIQRQKGKDWDNRRWFLIATSCVEAGVNLDFALGFRERCSVSSFIQVSGRINRHGERPFGKLIDFSIIAENGLNSHPGFIESSDILKNHLWKELVTEAADYNTLCSKALRKELLRFPKKQDKSKQLLANEQRQDFQEVAEDYRIINSDTATVIVERNIVDQLEMGIPVSWQSIQEHSVQLWMSRINKLRLREIKNCKQDRIYSWIDCYDYDPGFLGVMGGIIQIDSLFMDEGGVI